ncbi:MAG: hypothetical protein NDI67_05085 [Sulfuritalea sp.]|nr:hypothetical protein [Sulfuritalea sp.]
MSAALFQRLALFLIFMVGLLGPNFASNYKGTLLGVFLAAIIWLILVFAATVPIVSILRTGQYAAGASVIERSKNPGSFWSLVVMQELIVSFFLLLATLTAYEVAKSV